MPRLVALLFAVLILVLGATTCLPLLREKAVQNRVRLQMQDELRMELAKTRDLETQIARVKSDSVAIERLAREKFGLGRAGEVIFKFRELPTDAGASPSPVTPAPQGSAPTTPGATRQAPRTGR